jgi:hypothetical protein
MAPSDPTGNVAFFVERGSDEDTALLFDRAAVAVERLRCAIRSLAPDANITDTFEGAEAAAFIEILRSRLA